jgi:hypothetical protein
MMRRSSIVWEIGEAFSATGAGLERFVDRWVVTVV